jgi:NADH:ubiquinone reductase (H+-translocating)
MIGADALGKPRTAFRYFDKGDMATIGRHMAVAKVRWPFTARLSGVVLRAIWVLASVVTLKPAICGQFKTGHRDWPKT